jgi:hypothetical protein
MIFEIEDDMAKKNVPWKVMTLDLNETVDPNSLPDSDALLFSVSLAIALFFLTFLDLPVVGGFVSIFSVFIR